MSIKSLVIRKNKQNSVERFHPWIFSGAIETDTSDIVEGELVDIVGHKGQFIARGHFQPSTIAVRVLTFTDRPIDQDFYNEMVQNAVQMRLNLNLLNEKNNIFRLIHGEGDSLPGLIVDFYNERMNGRMRLAMMKPPAMKEIVAINDGS